NGDNTDVGGFDAAARELLGEISAHLTVAVIGAGGAAAAILGAVESWPHATVRLYARNAIRASALAKRFGDFVRAESSARSALAGAKLIVNATPIGMSDDSLPFSVAGISKGAAIL